MLTLLAFAFLAGLVTALSPCVIVVLPIILSSALGKSKVQPVATVVGLATSFCLFTLFLGSIVKATGISATTLRYASISIVFLFGVALLLPAIDKALSRLFNPLIRLGSTIDTASKSITSPVLSGLLLGVALGLLWTPCAGPILASVTSLVATQSVRLDAILLVSFYALGSALPMLAFALFGQSLAQTSGFLRKRSAGLRRVFGAIMMAMSLLMFAELDTQFVEAALKYVPVLNVDSNQSVSAELSKLKENKTRELALVDIKAWINSPPLTLKDLRGKVVLIDFWTYSCINCVRTFPYLKRWYDTYKDDGFVIIGVHTPEFAFEKEEDNVRRATRRFGIEYPVALDNDYATWNAFNNEAWPQHFLLDQDGVVREKHIGEGHYEETEAHIRLLLGKEMRSETQARERATRTLTPETYLGHLRAEAYAHPIVKDRVVTYAGSGNPSPDKVSLIGDFMVADESITSLKDGNVLLLNYDAAQVYLVLTGSSQTPLYIFVDNKSYGQIVVDEARMYDIVDLKTQARHLLKLIIPKGVSAFAFTFGDDT